MDSVQTWCKDTGAAELGFKCVVDPFAYKEGGFPSARSHESPYGLRIFSQVTIVVWKAK
jgi:hypothetical protein